MKENCSELPLATQPIRKECSKVMCQAPEIVLRLVTALTLFVLLTHCGRCYGQTFVPEAQVIKRTAFLNEKTKSITSVIRDAASANWGDGDEANARWTEAVEVAMAEFQMLATRLDRRHLVNQYVAEFGTEDDIADLAILLSMGRHGVPSQSANCGLASQHKRGPLNEEVDFYRSQQLLVAECQCRRFLESPESLKRYAHFLVWSGFLTRDSWKHYKSTAAVSIGTDEYWWHARTALVLMGISGQTPSEEVEPGRIAAEFERWLEQVSEFDVEMPDVASLKGPFSTWRAKNPIPGAEFRSIYDRRILLPRDFGE